MIDEIFKVKLISVRDCFLHFSSHVLQKLVSKNLSSTVKLIPHDNGMEMYFTWVPQSCSGLEEHCVGISAVYANTLGLSDNAIVMLSICDQSPVVKTVFVSAATQDDYEMMEMSQNELQLSLLDQIRVVSVNQPVTVWFSKTLHCTLYIDSMDMLAKRGRLEQLTDIVISPSIVKAENIGSPTSGLTYNLNRAENQSEISVTNGLRSDENSGCNIKLNEIVKKGKNPEIFRAVVLNVCDSSCCNNLHNNLKHPYNAFIMKRRLLSWANMMIEKNSAVVCFLSLVPNKLSKDLCKNKPDSGIYVRLYPVQDKCRCIPSINYANNFKNPVVYLSNTVKNILNLRTGSKVKLKMFVPCLDNKISHVELSFTDCLSKKEVDYWFREDLSKNNNTLVNNNAIMPIESCVGNVEQVIVSLWPATIPCWPFSSAELKSCNLSLNYIEDKEFNKSDDNESDKSKQDSDNDENMEPVGKQIGLNVLKSISHQSRTLGDILKEGLLSFELSLRLNSSSVLPQCEPVRKNNNVLCVGSGAYILVDWLCNRLSGSPHNVFISKIDCKSLKGKKGESIQKRLTEKLLRCIYYQPSLLVLLDLDTIAGTPSQPENKVEEIFLQGIGRMIRDILLENQFNQSVGILATARSSNSLNNEIVGPRSYHLFSTLLQIPTLSKDDRITVIKEIISSRSKVNNFNRLDLEEFALKTDGYNCEDLLLLADKAFFNAWQRKVEVGRNSELLLTLDDLLSALDSYTPTHLHSINLYKCTGHSWSSVGGMKILKESLTEIIIWPSKFRKVYDQCPLTSESGVLLFGVPGTGKTLLSSALAGEAGLNFISIKGPELLSKYIGASEEAVRKVFEKARKAKPCILFFDEFDSLAPRRGHDSSGVMDRVVNQLLTQMDGIEDRNGVYIVAATSRPDLLDPALLRPGRIGHSLHCPLPEAEDRLEIMRVLSRKLVLDEHCSLSFIAEQTAGFSGADLQALIYNAQMLAYDDLMNEDSISVGRDSDDFSVDVKPDVSNKLVVKNSHLLASLKDTNPSLKLEELRRYQKIYDNFQKMRSKTNQAETLPVEIAQNQKVTLA